MKAPEKLFCLIFTLLVVGTLFAAHKSVRNHLSSDGAITAGREGRMGAQRIYWNLGRATQAMINSELRPKRK